MKELDKVSDYITQLETERAELNIQIDALKSDIELLAYRVKNNGDHSIRDVGYKTKLMTDLATNIQDRVDIRDEDKIRSLYDAINETIAKSKSVDNNLTTPNDEVTVLRNFIKRLGTAVEWTYADQEEPWTESQINELTAIVEGNHVARKNLDTMADEIESITQEIQNDNFGLYRTFSSMHIALNTYKFECTQELAGIIQKLADSFIQSCSHLDADIGNLKVAQLCNLDEEIEDCQEQVHAWIARSGASRWLDHRP